MQQRSARYSHLQSLAWLLAGCLLQGCGSTLPSVLQNSQIQELCASTHVFASLCPAEARLSLVADGWQSFCLGRSCILPSWSQVGKEIEVQAYGPGLQGLLQGQSIAGHFISEINLGTTSELPRGLIIVPAMQLEDGREQADFRSYLFLQMDRDAAGHIRLRARDRQPWNEGFSEQVLDRTSELADWEKVLRYEKVLDGRFGSNSELRNDFHAPFVDADGRLRLMHHTSSTFAGSTQPFFYLSFFTSKPTLPGLDPAAGWMNLAPVAAWLQDDQRYFIGVVLDPPQPSSMRFSKLSTQLLPAAEPEDPTPGFRVVKQAYHWSGFAGDAVQIRFDQFFPASTRYRLVFWSEMNNVPAWHINDQLLVTQSFVELWPQNRWQSPGCFEAMSDDFLWNNTVTVLADSPVRKVIRWRSYLINPAYETIAQTLGQKSRSLDELAHTDEIWTVYPDGSAFRHIHFVPDPTGLGADSFEIAELSLIAGAKTRPVDHAADGASLELWNPSSSQSFRFRPSRGYDLDGHTYPKGGAPYDRWPQTAAVIRIKDGEAEAPLFYSAFSQSGVAASPPHRLFFDLSWHGYEWEFSHWPVDHEAYEYHDKSMARWEAQVSHASLVSVQVAEGGRSAAAKDFVSLVGLHSDPHAISARIQDWSTPPSVRDVSGCQAFQYEPRQGHIEFDWNGPGCSFSLISALNERDSVPLALKIRHWPGEQQPRLRVNGKLLDAMDWAWGEEGTGEDKAALAFIPPQKGGIKTVQISSSAEAD